MIRGRSVIQARLAPAPILSSAMTSSSGKSSAAAARFSRRWAMDDVPGISRILGARRSSQASATCIGVARRRLATSVRIDDCNGVKPPSGKERHVSSPQPRKFIDEFIVCSMRQVVLILHADDLAGSDVRPRTAQA